MLLIVNADNIPHSQFLADLLHQRLLIRLGGIFFYENDVKHAGQSSHKGPFHHALAHHEINLSIRTAENGQTIDKRNVVAHQQCRPFVRKVGAAFDANAQHCVGEYP